MKKIILLSLFVLNINQSFADDLNIPAGADIGSLTRELRQKSTAPQKRVNMPTAVNVNSQAPKNSEQIKLTLKNVKIKGASIYEKEELTKFYADLLGKKITLTQVYNIASELTQKYQNDGYILSFAIIPKQNIKDGTVEIQVIEGYVDQVRFSGDIEKNSSIYESVKSRILSSKPLQKSVLERSLIVLHNLPGNSMDSVISSSEHFAASALEVNFQKRNFDVVVAANNYGNKYSGEYQQIAVVSANSMLGFNETFSIRELTSFHPDRLRMADFSISMPLGSYGTNFNIGYNFVQSKPKINQDISVKGFSDTISLDLSHPFYLTNDVMFSVGTGLNVAKNENKINDIIKNEEKLSVANISTNLSIHDRFNGDSTLSLIFSKGLKIFGASEKGRDKLSRDLANPQFSKFNFSLGRKQPLGSNFSIQASINGQLTNDFLNSSNEFSAGGSRGAGRGFEYNSISAENGISANIEIDKSFLDFPQIKARAIQLYAFLEGAHLWKKDRTEIQKRDRTLYSSGFGLRTYFERNFFLNGEVAFPLNSEKDFSNQDLKKKPRLYFNMNFRF